MSSVIASNLPRLTLAATLALSPVWLPAGAQSPAGTTERAPRLQRLGDHEFSVTTAAPGAQTYFNQGIRLAYAFNHAEAGRSFREAARIDPSLAMAYWGQALVLGPNINAPMDPADEPRARDLAGRAQALGVVTASAREQALIEALGARYSGDPAARAANDKAFAAAMRRVHERFPGDPDIAMLYIESMMDVRPWRYWAPDGHAYVGTAEIVALTERVLESHPQHPLALHLYIHLIEPTDTPERAEHAADTLGDLMPAAGHIVHMPSHIYQRVGRYADSIRANELAVLADEDYIAQCRAQGIYPLGYYPHNVHFIWIAATADGQSRRAIKAARTVAATVDDQELGELFMLAGFRVVPYWALTRFGKWDEMLREPAPPPNPYLQGARHYARGLAYTAKGEFAAAERELHELRRILTDEAAALDQPLFSPMTAAEVLRVAPEALAEEIAAARGQYGRAIAHLATAVRLEDALAYTEPEEWHYPTRLALGAVLIAAGRAPEAEAVYWRHLAIHRDNGWALFGLRQALEAQGKVDEARTVKARFDRAWARADVTLTASRFAHRAPTR